MLDQESLSRIENNMYTVKMYPIKKKSRTEWNREIKNRNVKIIQSSLRTFASNAMCANSNKIQIKNRIILLLDHDRHYCVCVSVYICVCLFSKVPISK